MEAVGEVTTIAIRQAELTTVCHLDVTMEVLAALHMNVTLLVGLVVLGTRNLHRKCVHDIPFHCHYSYY